MWVNCTDATNDKSEKLKHKETANLQPKQSDMIKKSFIH